MTGSKGSAVRRRRQGHDKASINSLHFGSSSERLVALVEAQLALELGDLATDAPPPPANDDAPAKPRANRQPLHKPARRTQASAAVRAGDRA
jgi:hypothetical protein